LAATSRRVVPDDKARIASAIAEMTATGCNLVLTTGGTGCAPRDVTPEATASVLHKLAPGIVHAMTSQALAHEPHAALSRGIAGIRDRCMVINLPGRPRAAADNASALAPVLVHALRQVSGD
jgi:molybdenum cofactor synthesis domain-containing protein